MDYVLKIKTDHSVEIIERPDDVEYTWYAKQIGCDYIELVHPRYFGYTLVLDEEGKMKANRMNLIASGMYGTFEHGDPIVGDALLVNEDITDEGTNIIGFTLEKAFALKKRIENDKTNSVKFNKLINND